MAEHMTEDDNDDMIEEWSRAELVKRSQELQLLDENGHCVLPMDTRRDETSVTSQFFSDDGRIEGFEDSSGKSASTTSDSQVCFMRKLSFFFLKIGKNRKKSAKIGKIEKNRQKFTFFHYPSARNSLLTFPPPNFLTNNR